MEYEDKGKRISIRIWCKSRKKRWGLDEVVCLNNKSFSMRIKEKKEEVD